MLEPAQGANQKPEKCGEAHNHVAKSRIEK